MARAQAHFCAQTHPSSVLEDASPTRTPVLYAFSGKQGGEYYEKQRHRSRLQTTLEQGEHLARLLSELSGEDPSSRGRKPNSFRRLAERLNSVIAPSSMWRAVAIYELSREHPELAHYEHLGVGHLSVVLRFRGNVRLALMRKAEQLRWSRRRLQQEARRILRLQRAGLDCLEHGDLQRYIAAPQ